MFHIILCEPEIPPNTGNIIRLCANTGATLHLIHPLGFSLDDKRLVRAGLDYHEWTNIHYYDNLNAFLETQSFSRLFACSTKATQKYSDIDYLPGDAFIFGPETRGLPTHYLNQLAEKEKIRIPMRPHSRSLNLANAVSIILYEAWRQQNFQEAF